MILVVKFSSSFRMNNIVSITETGSIPLRLFASVMFVFLRSRFVIDIT